MKYKLNTVFTGNTHADDRYNSYTENRKSIFVTCMVISAIFFFGVDLSFARNSNDVSPNTCGPYGKQVSNNSVASAHKPGSGTALYFNGQHNYATLPSSVLANAKKFTIEYWIKTTESRSNSTFWQRPTMIGNETADAPSHDFGITTDNGRVGMWSGLHSGGDNWLLTNTKINDNKWHHIAAVNDGAKIILYVDGVLQDGSILSGNNLLTSARSLNIGAGNTFYANGGAFYHKGEYDEVRIWNMPLSQKAIRDRVCHKISPSDLLYNRLVAYYNFDEDDTDTAFDIANHYDALLINEPQRRQSGAPIGDTSVNMYGGGIKSLSLAAASGETFQVTSLSNQTKALHLYVVNESPEDMSGINTLCAQNKYFGVFDISEVNAAYSAIYDYNANECVTVANENDLRIYQKWISDSADWRQLAYLPDLTTNTITIPGIHRYNGVFILGLDSSSNTISGKTDVIKNNAAFMNIDLSPNPASSFLHVHINSIEQKNSPVTIRVVDQNYNQVWKTVSQQNDLVIDVHAFVNGVYFIQFISQQNMMTKKFIIHR